MLVLDTRTLPAGERADAFQATVSANCSSSLAVFEEPRALHAEMHVVELGPARVFTIDATGTTLRRTPRLARAMNECSIALALPMRSDNRMSWAQEDRVFGPRDLILVDLAQPYVYGWRGAGASYAVHVDVDDLGLPRDEVRTAMRELRRSPLYELVRDHVAHLTRHADELAASGTAAQVGAATLELVRALVVTAVGDARRLPDAEHASRAARAQAYVRSHLRDADLDAAAVARATGLSVRALYRLYEELGVSLEQSIIEQRLEGARRDLAAPRQRYASIAAAARAWGFTNASFFSSRFRAAYGQTPRQCRAGEAPTTRR